MHAYAAKDPVFLAQNRLGQQATAGALGDFCIRCHAPMAVASGQSVDGLNLGELPDALSGVTCFFCHNAAAVEGTHNNPIELARDATLRAGVKHPLENATHASAHSPLLSAAAPESASLCGACHDVVTPPAPAGHAIELERTFAEWSASVFAPKQAGSADAVLTCAACHMPAEPQARIADVENAPLRTRHAHGFPGVDVALSAFPRTGEPSIDDAGDNERLVGAALDAALGVALCVQRLPGPSFAVEVTLDNVNAGHAFPSGSSHNRQVWVELRAFDADDNLLYATATDDDAAADPEVWQLGDRAYDTDGNTTHAFWDIAGIERRGLSAAVTVDRSLPEFLINHGIHRFPSGGKTIAGVPARVQALVRVRPVAAELLAELRDDKLIDDATVDRMPTHLLAPNRQLASQAMLQSLSQVTLEWSDATRGSGLFDVWSDATSTFERECLGTARGR